MKMIGYTCPVCGHSGAHGVDMKAPLCDKCNYKVTMVVTDVHTKLANELGVSREIAKSINFGYLYGRSVQSLMIDYEHLNNKHKIHKIHKVKA